MKKKIIPVFWLTAAVAIYMASCSSRTSSTAGAEESGGTTIRVMSYNIHHGNPPSKPGVIDVDAIANVIRSQDPHLVALQEVDVNTERSGKDLDQAKEIAERLKMHFYFGKAIDYQGGEYGVAILSKYPMDETRVHHLPGSEDVKGEPRTMTTGRIKLPGGSFIRFGSTHLDFQRDPVNRRIQVDEIVKISRAEQLPFILAGDFNATPESDVMRSLGKEFERTCKACPLTSSAQNPVRTIDFILFRDPSGKVAVDNHEVINEKVASDHLPIVAELRIMD